MDTVTGYTYATRCIDTMQLSYYIVCMAGKAYVPTMQIRGIPLHIQRRGKAKAASLGLTLGEYFTRLIANDTEDIAHLFREESNDDANNSENHGH